MSPIYINLTLAFSLSLLGTLMFRSHLMSTLLCLEGMMLSLFMMVSISSLNINSMAFFPITNIIDMNI